MRKRYLIIGAFVLYALGRMLGNDPGGSEDRVANVSPSSEQRKQPETVSTETSKLAPTTAASEANPADGQKIEKREPVQNYPVRFLAGNRVAFRSGPSTRDTIIDRFDNGRQVLLMEESGEWSHIKDQLTQRDGWIASRFLAGRPKPRDKGTKNTAREEPVSSVPDSTIIQRIIAESLASYPGSCACPYNTDRGGRRCGKRSAYSKPGGYAPICYPQDVTKAMIDAFRRQ